jgi:hypothetical protein
MSRIVLASVVVCALAGLARGDDFNDVRTREQLVLQKWTREVNVALDAARRLERTDPAAARDLLQSALTGVRAAAGLDEKSRQDLSRQLESRLRSGDAVRPTPAPQPVAQQPTAPTTSPAPRPQAFAQAPATPPAGSLTDNAKAYYDKRKGTVDSTKTEKVDAGKSFNGTIAGVEKPAATPTGDKSLLVAPNHQEIMAKREPPLNKKEATVMKILGSQMAPDFSGMSLRQGFEYLNEKTGLLISPDPQSLKDANVDLDEQVNFKNASKMSVRAILRKILADKGLSYTVNENGVDVVTAEKARNTTVVRVYPISDLITPIQPQPQFVYNPFTGGFVPNIPGTGLPNQKTIAAAQIADLIKTSVDPSYWQPNGPGTIAFNELTGTLVIRASAEIQFMVSGAIYRR